jgi:hypothetical protein
MDPASHPNQPAAHHTQLNSCLCFSNGKSSMIDDAAGDMPDQLTQDAYGFLLEALTQQQLQARAACAAQEAGRLPKWQQYVSSNSLPSGAALKRYCRKVGDGATYRVARHFCSHEGKQCTGSCICSSSSSSASTEC